MGICDWWSKRKFDKALKRGNEALDRSALAYSRISDRLAEAAARDRNAELRRMVDKLAVAKPDTVESVLNQFIALGHDKPEVVIKGKSFHGGGGRYEATIDGNAVHHTIYGHRFSHFATLESVEQGVIVLLKYKLGRVPVETIEITY